VKVTGAEVALRNEVDAAFVAVTTHVPITVAFKVAPFREHPEPVTAKVTRPVPDPPVVKRLTGVPTLPARPLPMINGAWGPGRNRKITGAVVDAGYWPLLALVAVTGHAPTAKAVSFPVAALMEHVLPVVA
jgi:hypothetical protein